MSEGDNGKSTILVLRETLKSVNEQLANNRDDHKDMFEALNRINVTIARLVTVEHCNQTENAICDQITIIKTSAALEKGKMIGMSAIVGAVMSALVALVFKVIGK